MTKLKNYSDRFDYLMNTIFGQNPKESLIKMTLSRQKSVRWCTSWKRHVLKSKKVWREEDLAHRVCKEEHPQGGEAKVQFLNWHLLGRCDLNDWAATATSWVGRLQTYIARPWHCYFWLKIKQLLFQQWLGDGPDAWDVSTTTRQENNGTPTNGTQYITYCNIILWINGIHNILRNNGTNNKFQNKKMFHWKKVLVGFG